jgi:hypothetical protein
MSRIIGPAPPRNNGAGGMPSWMENAAEMSARLLFGEKADDGASERISSDEAICPLGFARE